MLCSRMKSGTGKSSLEGAERIYNCPFLYITRREKNSIKEQQLCSLKTQETKLRKHVKSQIKCKGDDQKKLSIQTKICTKKDKGLTCKQQARFQQLLSVYAEQSSHSFRPTARNVGELPKVVFSYERENTTIDTFGKNALQDGLPKISASETNPARKRRSSKAADIHLPSIITE